MGTDDLSQVYRKINLLNQVGKVSNKKKNLCQWIKLLAKIDDSKLQKICGTDIALYIIWLRYASTFF